MKEVQQVSISELKPHSTNSKIYGNEENVDDLVAHIQESGWIQPLIINEKKEIISGHRRFKAACILGLESVPCTIESFEDSNAELERLLLENVGRQKTVEQRVREAEAFKKLEGWIAQQKRILQCKGTASKKTRDILAEKAGLGSGYNYSKAVQVVTGIDDFLRLNKLINVEVLRALLNHQSVDIAVKFCQAMFQQKKDATAFIFRYKGRATWVNSVNCCVRIKELKENMLVAVEPVETLGKLHDVSLLDLIPDFEATEFHKAVQKAKEVKETEEKGQYIFRPHSKEQVFPTIPSNDSYSPKDELESYVPLQPIFKGGDRVRQRFSDKLGTIVDVRKSRLGSPKDSTLVMMARVSWDDGGTDDQLLDKLDFVKEGVVSASQVKVNKFPTRGDFVSNGKYLAEVEDINPAGVLLRLLGIGWVDNPPVDNLIGLNFDSPKWLEFEVYDFDPAAPPPFINGLPGLGDKVIADGGKIIEVQGNIGEVQNEVLYASRLYKGNKGTAVVINENIENLKGQTGFIYNVYRYWAKVNIQDKNYVLFYKWFKSKSQEVTDSQSLEKSLQPVLEEGKPFTNDLILQVMDVDELRGETVIGFYYLATKKFESPFLKEQDYPFLKDALKEVHKVKKISISLQDWIHSLDVCFLSTLP